MQQILLSQIDPETLIKGISDNIIENILEAIKSQNPLRHSSQETLSRQQAANYLHITLPTLDRYRNEGRVPFYKTGRTIYFKQSEIDEALAIKFSKTRISRRSS